MPHVIPIVDAQVGSQIFPICFSQAAIYKLEEISQKPIGIFGLLVQAGRAGAREIQQLVWAGLEGGRLKRKSRATAFTMDEVAEIIDEAGGTEALVMATIESDPNPFALKILEAWKGAFPISDRLQREAEAKEKAKAGAGGEGAEARPPAAAE